MPRKTKDTENKELEVIEGSAKKSAKSNSVKKTSTKKTATAKKTESKSTSTKKAKTTTSKKTMTSKKSSTSKKSTVKKSTTRKSSKKVDVVEYYDLPYRYNQTIVKVLAQTPTNLFIYWDISDEDRENYKKEYGENFFETTKPILKIFNDTMNYSFEVEINDFANSWYLHVNDSKCDYRVELGRRPIYNNSDINADYVYISTSNEIESPNDKILFNKFENMVYFRNVKTQKTQNKNVANLTFIRNMGKIYNIYDIYKNIYKNEEIKDINNLSNPSSGAFL